MDSLTPDRALYRPLAILHEGKLRDIVLLEEVASGRQMAGHRLKIPLTAPTDQLPVRLQAQAARLQRLNVGRVAAFRGTVQKGGEPWLLFDHVDGHALSQYQPPVGIPADWVAFWLLEMLQVLDQVHGRNEMIGGFAPADLVAGAAGLTFVDVGVVQHLLPEAAVLSRSQERGAFMAPEQRSTVLYTAEGDVWSAGAIAFWLATGQPPEDGRVALETRVDLILMQRPELLRVVAEVIAELIQFQPAERVSARRALDHLALATTAPEKRGRPAPALTLTLQALPPETAGPERVATAEQPEEIPEEVPAERVPPSDWRSAARDVYEDTLWALDIPRKPWRAAAGLLGAGLVVVMGARWMGFGAALPPPPPKVMMTVKKGEILISTHATDWRGAVQLTEPALVVASQTEGVSELAFGGTGRLELEPKASFRLERVGEDQMAIAMVSGQGSAVMPKGVTGTIVVPGGTVTCAPGAQVDVSLNGTSSTEVTVKVRSGNVRVEDDTMHGVKARTGNTVAMGGRYPHPQVLP